ncbi:phosphoribosylanthranilate isomerase [Thiotrichales bacterium 19S9-12]|nr:phosphoribosylanthranilate isomerase [Thiotrichales bacterium 19S9-11]MCF6811031.1 phosphoribosylanthranilate isomerase [Thiotrichales bacterium 19S9-12]
MVRVKICGITNLDDALFAAKCGADALGFIFYKKSKRFIEPLDAKKIIQNLPPFIQSVGLFVNQSKDEVNQVLDQVPLNLSQFHGNETNDFCLSFKRPFIKAIHLKEQQDFSDACNYFPNAQALLLDHREGSEYGGTGNRFDWSLIPDKRNKPIILAGGLNTKNITTAIEKINPDAVDVSSGIEKIPGIKDLNLVRKFIACAKSTNA